MKKTIAIVSSLLLSASIFAGCGSKAPTTPTTAPSGSQPSASQTAAPKDFKVGIIFTEAGLGGQSFNDLAFEGVKKAATDLGITYDYVEPKSVSDEAIVQEDMASSGEYGIIICVGAEQIDALKKVAASYPEQKFALIDANLELPNVACYTSKEQEGSFMAGALAALIKQDKVTDKVGDGKTVGVMVGVNNPLLNRFVAGYTAGAKYINPELEVLVDYVGGFGDPTTAKNIATTFNSKGADVIFHAAGASGMGLFQAAQEKGFVAIGVNLNQNGVAPDNIVASMMKRVDSSAYHAIESTLNGEFKAGLKVMGLADEGVGLNMDGSNIKLPESVTKELDAIKALVVSGKLVIPATLEEVNTFLEANKK
ncbi:MAG: BMP family ABC transporter substrate-binding protein [Youngiibacter sp.]|jgi:basic membrane protein A|nr:BMP family ABC transporter substrate-binding protein [Youngiibacter sp.]